MVRDFPECEDPACASRDFWVQVWRKGSWRGVGLGQIGCVLSRTECSSCN